MGINPGERYPSPSTQQQIISAVHQNVVAAKSTVRSNAVLFAFVFGEIVGILLTKLGGL